MLIFFNLFFKIKLKKNQFEPNLTRKKNSKEKCERKTEDDHKRNNLIEILLTSLFDISCLNLFVLRTAYLYLLIFYFLFIFNDSAFQLLDGFYLSFILFYVRFTNKRWSKNEHN